MINFGILGLGKIARKFADDLRLVEGAQLVAVGSRSAERATAFAQAYQVPFSAGSYASIFTGPRVDVVYIATPHTTHAQLCKLCLERGVAVICEKPLGISHSEVQELIQLSRKQKVYLLEALWTKFLPSFIELQRVVNAGSIGSITGLRADFGFKVTDKHSPRILNLSLGGGALLDIGIYPVFLAIALLGEPSHIAAVARFHESGADIDDTIVLAYEDGTRASLHTTLLAKTKTEAVIYGTSGTIYMHGDWYKQTRFDVVPDDEEQYTIAPEPEGWGYVHEARAVVADLNAGRLENELWTHANTLLLHQTLTKIRDQIGLVYPSEQA